MKQLEDNKICKYCYGCGKLELENFNGVINCKDFIKAKDTTKYYEALREMMKKVICRERTIKGKTTKYYYCNILKKAVDDNKCEICPIRRKFENEKVNRLFKMMFGGWK